MFRVAEDSPLRCPTCPLSEEQIVKLDGIRYSADMAGIALDRLWQQLCFIDSNGDQFQTHNIAAAALDAWSIIDAAHRMWDLVNSLSIKNEPWKRVFKQSTELACRFRNLWQHQASDAAKLLAKRGQAWGALAWVKHQNDRPTGEWFLAVAGSDFVNSQWIFAGPHTSIPRVSTRRIRLIHFNEEIYLERLVGDMFEAIRHLEAYINGGKLGLRGQPVNGPRSKDWVIVANVVFIYRKAETANDP